MENITTTSAHDLVEKIKKGEISSVEVCEAYLERIKKLTPIQTSRQNNNFYSFKKKKDYKIIN